MADRPADFLARVFDCIRAADRDGLATNRGQDVLGGLSGLKTVGALQRLVGLFADDPAACYLEVGVFQGLSLLSVAAAHPGVPCFGIDNFSILDPRGENLGIVNQRMARLDARNATLINQDFEDALDTIGRHLGGRRIAVYFVDGAHDYRSQLMGLLLALPHLHERAVVLVDDANYPDVRLSTRDFLLARPDFKMVFDAYSPAHPANLDKDALAAAEAGWLNGVNILVRDPEGVLPVMMPPTEPSRLLHVNEWLIHRHPLAELAPEALDLARAGLLGGDRAEAEARLAARYEPLKAAVARRFPDRNVYSAGLPERRYNARS
ncbi:MAG: class I SAM-dependent methyltransferase [Alphaproteobacteria bacterium]|nr:class I SAM-dependent methyltransferase [Alphaproteobacteria bacterium]